MNKKKDSHRRSFTKAVSWRFVAVMITTSIAWGLTGETTFAATIGVIDTVLKFGCYYLHERVWDQIDFGRTQPAYISIHSSERSEEHDITKLGSTRCARVGRSA